MATAFRTYTPDGVEQLNSELATFRVIAHGTAGASSPMTSSINLPRVEECPILLVRPRPNALIGGLECFLNWWSDARYSFIYGATGAFDWAIASVSGEPELVGDGKVGIKIYNRGGILTFSSQYRYPRIVCVEEIATPARGAVSISKHISGWDEMPWIMATDLIYTLDGGDNEGGVAPPAMFCARINGSFDTLTIEMRDASYMSYTWPFDPAYNPFSGRNLRIPLCKIPGL